MRKIYPYLILIAFIYACGEKPTQTENTVLSEISTLEKHRPQFHFTPDSMWMNDPNGMVFYKDTYHLFYQYYPDSTVWGPMHWGHAVSKDMVSWEHKPIALYPDELGYIFSGSAVLDVNNSSGLGSKENPPLVAIFTYHDPIKAEAKQIDVESQGIAFSLDNGETWEKYAKNPVLKNPGIRDFRDPKVRWFEPTQRWIMTLAAQDHIRFYSSPNLKEWILESEFGKELGAHDGVWECPDLFPITVEGENEMYWILIVNLNPGAPNGGSGTQYFIGKFNGHTFVNTDEKTRWADYGPDNYAGVTWSNTGDRILFMGWMSNWKYANIVPTEKWRSATTIARELKLQKIHGDLVLCSLPVEEFEKVTSPVFETQNLEIDAPYNVSKAAKSNISTCELNMEIEHLDGFKVILSNELSNQVMPSYDKKENRFLIDRSKSGNVSFHPEFGNEIITPRISTEKSMKLKLVIDVASMEVFADDGSTVLTVVYFPNEALDQIAIVPETTLSVSKLSMRDIE